MTQQRSNDEIRADIAAMDASAMWSDRYHDALIRVLRDVHAYHFRRGYRPDA